MRTLMLSASLVVGTLVLTALTPADAQSRSRQCSDDNSRFVNGYGWVCRQPQYRQPRHVGSPRHYIPPRHNQRQYQQPQQRAYYLPRPQQQVAYGHSGYEMSQQRVTRSQSAHGSRAVAARRMPPLQPQVPPPGMRSSQGAIPVDTAIGIRHAGGGAPRGDGSRGRAGLSPDGRPACYRF